MSASRFRIVLQKGIGGTSAVEEVILCEDENTTQNRMKAEYLMGAYGDALKRAFSGYCSFASGVLEKMHGDILIFIEGMAEEKSNPLTLFDKAKNFAIKANLGMEKYRKHARSAEFLGVSLLSETEKHRIILADVNAEGELVESSVRMSFTFSSVQVPYLGSNIIPNLLPDLANDFEEKIDWFQSLSFDGHFDR